jgi:hypothetical protein
MPRVSADRGVWRRSTEMQLKSKRRYDPPLDWLLTSKMHEEINDHQYRGRYADQPRNKVFSHVVLPDVVDHLVNVTRWRLFSKRQATLAGVGIDERMCQESLAKANCLVA